MARDPETSYAGHVPKVAMNAYGKWTAAAACKTKTHWLLDRFGAKATYSTKAAAMKHARSLARKVWFASCSTAYAPRTNPGRTHALCQECGILVKLRGGKWPPHRTSFGSVCRGDDRFPRATPTAREKKMRGPFRGAYDNPNLGVRWCSFCGPPGTGEKAKWARDSSTKRDGSWWALACEEHKQRNQHLGGWISIARYRARYNPGPGARKRRR